VVERPSLVIDTGRERLSAYAGDGALIQQVAPCDHGWGLGPDGHRGHHFDSVHRDGDRVLVVAHNYDDPPEIWELTWPDLKLTEIHATTTAWAHNTWDGELGLAACDSRFGRLHEVHSGETIWAVLSYDPIERPECEWYLRLVSPGTRRRVTFVGGSGDECPRDSGIVDLLYIDSSHQRDDTIREVEAWRPALGEGTVVVFDDPHAEYPAGRGGGEIF
jgi:Methyltransferase domain